ncbi:unnamed protein product, partial [Meganyctiphanes norvegica]
MNTLQNSSSIYVLRKENQVLQDYGEVSAGFNILGMVMTSAVCFLGSIGCALTMCTIIHQCWLPKRMRSIPKLTADTVLIFNLALADFLYCVVALPPMFAMYYCHYKNEDCSWLSANMGEAITFCEVSAFFRYYIAICEWTTLGLMAVERCVAIYSFRHKTHHNKFFTPAKTACICLLLWLISMTEILNVFDNNYAYNEEAYKCDYNSTCTEPGNISNLNSPRGTFFIYKFFIPSILILIGYLLILYQIYYSGKRMM